MAHHKHQRSRWTGTQLSLILLLMASTASISAFYLGSYAHNMLLIMHQPIDQHTTKTGGMRLCLSGRLQAGACDKMHPAYSMHQ